MQLVHVADERDHDLRPRVLAGLLDRHGGVEDGAGLDLDEVGDHEAQAAAAQTQHRVLLVHRLDGGQQLLVLGGRRVAGLGHLDELLLEVGQELVERRVDEADDDRQAAHGRQDALEVALLEDLQLGHGGVERGQRLALVGRERLAGGDLGLGAGGHVGHEDRATHDLQPLALAEHVLGAAEADALGAVAAGLCGLLGLVGVGPDLHAADLVRPAQDLLELGLVLEAGLDGRQRADEDLAGGAVDADPVALAEGHVGQGRRGRLGGVVDDELGAAGDAGLADLAGHDGRVRRGATAGGQDALGHGHAVEVVRAGLDAHEDDLLALLDPLDGGVGVEDRPTHGGAGGGVEALGDLLGTLAGVGIELGTQELVHLGGLDAGDGLSLGDDAFLDHLDGDLDGRRGGALGDARLEHVELAALDGELEVLDVPVVGLELVPDLEELLVGRGHLVLEAG